MYSNRFWTRVQIFWALNHEANPIIPALSLSRHVCFFKKKETSSYCPSVREKGRGKNNNVSNKKNFFWKEINIQRLFVNYSQACIFEQEFAVVGDAKGSSTCARCRS